MENLSPPVRLTPPETGLKMLKDSLRMTLAPVLAAALPAALPVALTADPPRTW